VRRRIPEIGGLCYRAQSHAMRFAFLLIAAAFLFGAVTTSPRQISAAVSSTDDIRMVVILTRHGVRSPTHPSELAAYAARPWPTWSAHPGYLTERGALLMRQFGAYYRRTYSGMAAFATSACPPANAVFIWADVDERTRATAQALVEGLSPGCNVPVHHVSGKTDPLFDPIPAPGKVDVDKSRASMVGAIGGDPSALHDAYRSQFSLLDDVLGCRSSGKCKVVSQVPSSVTSKGDSGLATLYGGIDLASTAVENLVLEYTDGQKDVGWGQVDGRRLLDLLALHVVQSRLEHGNFYTARVHSSNILMHIAATLEQGATNETFAGTRVPPQSSFVVMVGHDTQLEELAGLLHLSWLMRGYQLNDAPPGGALVFELHASADSVAKPFVRIFFTAQSMDAMRVGDGRSPSRVPVYVPGCPSLDCPIGTFSKIADSAVDPSFTAPWP
jgi:4-phytase/acid phosphatase